MQPMAASPFCSVDFEWPSSKFGFGIEDKGTSKNKDEIQGFFPIRLRSWSELQTFFASTAFVNPH
jgi:hypothetical protein